MDMKNKDSINELSTARDELGQNVMKLVKDFQDTTGHLVSQLELKFMKTPQGLFQDLALGIDTFDEMKPKRKSNILPISAMQLSSRS